MDEGSSKEKGKIMLALSRKASEAVWVGDQRVVVLWIDHDRVCLLVELGGAPIQQKVVRNHHALHCYSGWIEVLSVRENKVRLGFQFPDEVPILREELTSGRRKRKRSGR